jgi:hypothetical protein
MAFQEYSERLGLHGKNLLAAIAEVADRDKDLASKLATEYDGILQAMIDMIDYWSKRLEH